MSFSQSSSGMAEQKCLSNYRGERYKVQGGGVYKVQGEGVYKVQGTEDFSENAPPCTMICRANASVEVYSLIKSFIYRGNGHKVILGTNGWLKGRKHFSLTKKLLSKIKSFKRSSSTYAWLVATGYKVPLLRTRNFFPRNFN